MISVHVFYACAGALMGAVLGSYLGMASWRIPRHLSLTGRSHCPGCGKTVPGYLNLPIVGYLALRGRAACCGARLSPWYVALEALNAAIGFALGWLLLAWGLVALFCVVVLGSLLWKAVADRRVT